MVRVAIDRTNKSLCLAVQLVVPDARERPSRCMVVLATLGDSDGVLPTFWDRSVMKSARGREIIRWIDSKRLPLPFF